MNLFEELDDIISKAVLESMGNEKKLQKKQAAIVDKLGLRASDENQKNVKEEEEAEETEEEEVKLKGSAKSKKRTDNAKDDSSSEETGTASSKKLKDPSKKQLSKPTFTMKSDKCLFISIVSLKFLQESRPGRMQQLTLSMQRKKLAQLRVRKKLWE